MKAVSCNGCRILRKGCRKDCVIRPCIEWIDSPESQANATLFLAKYYGRASLLKLINAGPENQRISLFKSLLYEACGRILNPVHGSLGLLYSSDWHKLEAAIGSVLRGSSIATGTEDASPSTQLPLAGCDIRHVSKDKSILPSPKRVRTRSKRPISEVDNDVCSSGEDEAQATLEDKGGVFFRNFFGTEKNSEETVEQESSLRLPSMEDLASPTNKAELQDKFCLDLFL